ncbi:S41 family peptidase [Pedobacter metabolipauper]|nr:S41 family peptidase [Pedobacter metabolipauper]
MNSTIYLKLLKVFLFSFIIILPLRSLCQINNVGLERISAYGKVWGVINYFHPEMGKGKLNGDSLFLKHLSYLPENPSAINFKRSVAGMLGELHDPQISITEKYTSTDEMKLTARKQYAYHLLPGKQLYLALPQTAFAKGLNTDSILRRSPSQKIVVDLRNADLNNDLGLKQYKRFVQPLIAGIIHDMMLLPTERSFFYKGLMRQDFPQDINLFDPDKDGNVDHLQVHNGLRNVSEGAYLLPVDVENYSSYRYCFIINRFTNINSVKAIMALRNRNRCLVVFDGPVPDYLYGTFYYMNLPDGLVAKIRTSEVIYEDGTLGPAPDLVISGQSDTTLHSLSVVSAGNLLKMPIKLKHGHVENTVLVRKPSNKYATNGMPGVNLRLLGLFNFWNTIHFFSPNKNLIALDWDTALLHFIPKFLAADHEDKYFMALMELTASIKDGHAILINTVTGRSPSGFMDGNLPFACDQIDDKVYITSIMPDSAQHAILSQLNYGDELIAIDGLPVRSIINKWEPLLPASNAAGFKRELYATWLTAGAVNSEAKITLVRNGRQKNINLKRINRNDYYNLWGKVIRPVSVPAIFPPVCRILDGNIGYLRMNRIYTNQLDSLANLLRDCKKIIVDARGYPRDGSIGTNLATYIASKTDTVSYDEFPFVTGPNLSKRQMMIDYSVIAPKPNPNLKHQQYYILVDEGNQSQGEWNIIALQGVTKAVTIGRTTAGANGMAVTVTLPGNYTTFFSGFGEYYTDHIPNQKNGVKIDIEVKKTLKAAINGEDDIFNKALSIIKEK